LKPGVVTCASTERFCCNILNPVTATPPTCGIPPVISFTGYVPTAGQASYAEYPWMALVLGTDNTYVGGGVLIDSTTVLTVAHKVRGLA